MYALGCVLHEMLTGQPPFTGDTGAAIIGQHLHRDAEPPSRLVPDLPPAVDAMVLRMLATEPDQRHPDMAAVIDDIERVRGGGEPAAAPLAATAVLPDGPHHAGGASLPPTTRVDRPTREDPRRDGRAVLMGIGAIVAALVLLVAWRALAPQATEQADAPTAATDAPAATDPAEEAEVPTETEVPAETEAPTETTPATEEDPGPPDRPASVDEAAAAFRRELEAGRAEGGISAKAVEELDKAVTEIVEKSRDDKPEDVQKKAKELQEKIDEQVEKGEITSSSLADRLRDAAQDFRRVA